MAEIVGRVVVGYDGSPSSVAAITWAAAEAAERGLGVTVVHAVDFAGLLAGGYYGGPELWLDDLMDDARTIAKAGETCARDCVAGLDVRHEAHHGRPAEVLVAAARAAALLVVGTRGRGEPVEGLLGSVAAEVSAHAECPVVVVRRGADRHPDVRHPVVVGVDGSPSSAAACTFAAHSAHRAGASLLVVTAWHRPIMNTWMSTYWAITTPGSEPEVAAHAVAERVAQNASRAAAELVPGLNVLVLVGEGNPASVVLSASRFAGLVVMGARGRGSLTAMLLGSVSRSVVHGARSPVAVVRAAAAPDAPVGDATSVALTPAGIGD